MSKDKKIQMGVLGLVVGLVVVLMGSLLFVGAVAGWFDDPKVGLDAEYYNVNTEFKSLSANEYEDLKNEKKSFVVFIDQEGCTTADRLEEYMTKYMEEKGINSYRMMFSEVKKSSLHDSIKYYPSLAIVEKGKVKYFLRADSDEDAIIYNDSEEFKNWMDRYIRY